MDINLPIEKPWGAETLLEVNDSYAVKRLTMNKGKRCSLQVHEKKRETIFVLSGTLQVKIGDEDRCVLLQKGSFVTIAANVPHRMSAPMGKVEYLECSTPELDDVVRLSDDFGRV
jgi:mannose-6-phosphate isomerase-like protein (cupin superfamily)